MYPPSIYHLFGTDISGNDLLLRCVSAFFIEIFTLLSVSFIIYFLGIAIGLLLVFSANEKIRTLFLQLVQYWITLPVLLLSFFLVITFGSGQICVILAMSFMLIPTQGLFIYNELENAAKSEFILAKISYGFSWSYILIKHIVPYVKPKYDSYTLGRLPEILLLDLAMNFLGLGIQPPNTSFGRMLFDGLAFMFSAWWMWFFPMVLLVACIYYLTQIASAKEGK